MFSHLGLQPGSILGERYKIVRLLGEGGTGRVFLAEDMRLPGKLWAVKEMGAGALDHAAFEQEARFLVECSHPGLAAIIDFFPPDKDDSCCLVMEYIAGDTLLQLFQQQQPFPWRRAVDIAVQLCEVLAYLHEARQRPVIHRDLKPSNVMMDENGRIRLIDFGTARYYNSSASADTVCLGTRGFAAPEQFLGGQTDARTDLYTLGALLFFLLSGGTLWEGKEQSLGLEGKELPEGLVHAVYKLLEEKPQQRFQRAAEVGKVLQRVMHPIHPPVHGQVTVNEEKSGALQQRIIIGSLTPGSGASFTTIALARLLNRLRLKHQVVELPATRPDLYHTLLGEQKAPDNYIFAVERALSPVTSAASVLKPWRNGYTEWMPLPPNWQAENQRPGLTTRLLQQMSAPAAIMDIGCGWREDGIQELCRSSSLILLVCGPSPIHLSRTDSGQVWAMLSKLQAQGTEVCLVANRSLQFSGKNQWLAALPSEPLCCIPELPSRLVLAALWQGRLIADHPKVAPLLAAALEPVVQKIRIEQTATPGKATPWQRLRDSLRV